MSEQPFLTALHQICTEIRDNEIENLKVVSLEDKRVVMLNRQQVFELSERIQSLPQDCRDVLLARYCYKMNAEEIENIYSLNDARGKCLYAEKLLGYVLDLSGDEIISPENLADACKVVDERISSEIRQGADNHKSFATSGKHKRKMRDILRRNGKPSKLFLTMQYAAMFALVLFLSGAITLSVNAELREKFFNWVITNYEKYSSFSLVSDYYPDINYAIINDRDELHLAFIPDGFELSEKRRRDDNVYALSYHDKNDNRINVFVDMNKSSGYPDFDWEIVEDIFIGEQPAKLHLMDDLYIIEWELQGYYISLLADRSDRETALRIAENIWIEPNTTNKDLPYIDLYNIHPGYIPDGYKRAEEHVNYQDRLWLKYKDNAGNEMVLHVTSPYGEKQNLNTEGVVIEDILVNGNKGYYWNRSFTNSHFVVWEQQGYLFTVITYLDRETAMRIAENIQIEETRD